MTAQDDYHRHLSACKHCQCIGKWGKNTALDLCTDGAILYAAVVYRMDEESYAHFRNEGHLWAQAWANAHAESKQEALDTLLEMVNTLREQVESTAQLVLDKPLHEASGEKSTRFRYALAHLGKAAELLNMVEVKK